MLSPDTNRQRKHYQDVLQECVRRKLSRIHDEAEEWQRYARNLIMAGGDVAEELKEARGLANALLLVIGLLELEHKRRTDEIQTQPTFVAAE